jgi:pyruvate-formate lyase-activating enzyme
VKNKSPIPDAANRLSHIDGRTNVYHITYEPKYRVLDLHFWGCNLNCRGCYKNYDIYDLGLSGKSINQLPLNKKAEPPENFLTRDDIMEKIKGLEVKQTIFMGKETALDPEMPALAAAIHNKLNSYNILLTNGLKMAELSHIDEVVFSFKAFSEVVHLEYTGISNQQILNNFKTIYNSGKQLQAEIALIPGLVENKEIEALAKFIAEIDNELTFRVTSYFAVPDTPWPPASSGEVKHAALLAEKYLKSVTMVTTEMKAGDWEPIRIY